MLDNTELFEQIVNLFRRLPGVGRKTAERYAYHLLSLPEEEVADWLHGILAIRKHVYRCSECQDFTTTDPCSICASLDRDDRLLCVVEKPSGVVALERAGGYNGKYYVLHGVLSPLDGIGPDELRLSKLFNLIQRRSVNEVILATSATSEGEATALYIAQQLKPMNVRTTRIAHGVPMGAGLEFTDDYTLRQAMEWRKPLE